MRSWKWYGSYHIASFQSSAKIATQLFAVQKYRSLSMLWGHKLLVFIKHRTSIYQLIPTEDLIFEEIRVVGLNWRGCYIILRKMTLQCIGMTTATQLSKKEEGSIPLWSLKLRRNSRMVVVSPHVRIPWINTVPEAIETKYPEWTTCCSSRWQRLFGAMKPASHLRWTESILYRVDSLQSTHLIPRPLCTIHQQIVR